MDTFIVLYFVCLFVCLFVFLLFFGKIEIMNVKFDDYRLRFPIDFG